MHVLFINWHLVMSVIIYCAGDEILRQGFSRVLILQYLNWRQIATVRIRMRPYHIIYIKTMTCDKMLNWLLNGKENLKKSIKPLRGSANLDTAKRITEDIIRSIRNHTELHLFNIHGNSNDRSELTRKLSSPWVNSPSFGTGSSRNVPRTRHIYHPTVCVFTKILEFIENVS
jgi:hypothetical protein